MRSTHFPLGSFEKSRLSKLRKTAGRTALKKQIDLVSAILIQATLLRT